MREQTLDRLIKIGLEVVAAGIVLVAIIYVLDRPGNTPSLVERQITAGEKAVRANPTNVGMRLQLAEVYRAANRPDSALEQYNAVLKAGTSQVALLGRGEILAQKGELAAARKSFEKVVGKARTGEYAIVNPQLESAHYNLAAVMLKQHQAKPAMQEAKKALKIEPTDADAWYLLGEAAYGSGSYDQSVKALKQAVLFVPSGWCQPYEVLVKAYQAKQRKPQAEYAAGMLELCEKKPAGATQRLKGLTSGPVAVEAMLGLGMAAEAQSEPTSAINWYRRVLAVDPGNFNARGGLTRLSTHTGGT